MCQHGHSAQLMQNGPWWLEPTTRVSTKSTFELELKENSIAHLNCQCFGEFRCLLRSSLTSYALVRLIEPVALVFNFAFIRNIEFTVGEIQVGRGKRAASGTTVGMKRRRLERM